MEVSVRRGSTVIVLCLQCYENSPVPAYTPMSCKVLIKYIKLYLKKILQLFLQT